MRKRSHGYVGISSLLMLFALSACAAVEPGDEPDPTGSFAVMQQGNHIPDGGQFCLPLDVCSKDSAAVALFSENRPLFGLVNNTEDDITIDDVVLTPDSGNMAEEWTLIDTELIPNPLNVAGQVISPGDVIDFYPRFYPVQSGERSATIEVHYNGSETYSFKVIGYGSYESYFFSTGMASMHKMLGGADSDELTGGMVMGADGSVYYTANVSQIIDTFSKDILIAKTDANGSLVWAKIWNGPFQDDQPDTGQNSETGGNADSIAMDDQGFIYVVGRTSPTNSNSTYYSLILKIDPNDGSIVWEKIWSPKGQMNVASDSSMFYGVHAAGGLIFATGAALGESEASLVIFDEDGSVVGAMSFDVNDGYNDRGYTVRTDDNGNAYIGGNGDGDAFLLKIDLDGDPVALEWVSLPALGTGGNINSMDVDPEGNVYVAYDVRGAASHFVFGKVDPTGTLVWTKEYAANFGDSNNVHVVRHINGALYAGGRTGPTLLDAQMGDGLMVKVDPTDGSELWATEYFTGKGPDEMTEHRVKGIGVVDGEIVHLMQSYGGSMNFDRYWGYWYEATGSLTDYTVNSQLLTNVALGTLPNNDTEDATGARTGYVDAPASVAYTDAHECKGSAPDANVMLLRITE